MADPSVYNFFKHHPEPCSASKTIIKKHPQRALPSAVPRLFYCQFCPRKTEQSPMDYPGAAGASYLDQWLYPFQYCPSAGFISQGFIMSSVLSSPETSSPTTDIDESGNVDLALRL
ncbi:hypothetical protein V6N13_111742 [Hibiscus sabdariffa]|uniref:Uncharacterized protein n=1 Tax=Hibiscus sabdariffa TaxID=183260 RepID=A0ABR2TLN3_9ROSI